MSAPKIQQKFLLTSWVEGKHLVFPFYAGDKDEAIDKAMEIIRISGNPDLETMSDVDGERDGHIAMIIRGRAFVRR